MIGNVGLTMKSVGIVFFFFSSRRRHTRSLCDWSSDVCSSDLKKPDILELIDEEEADIIAGTETWLNTDISSSEFFPPNYHILRQDCIGSSHGGALLAIKSELSVERIDSPIQL